MERLWESRVAVFGIGGVGGYAVEALVRSGIGKLDLIDDDRVCLTNLNRQLHATRKTVGKYKVDVAEERAHEINPECRIHTYKMFFMPDTRDHFDFTAFDYVIDAIDTVTGKLALVEAARDAAVFKIFCKRANCDAQMISGARGHCPGMPTKAATASAAWPWQVAGEMLKWMADGKLAKTVIPIAVGEKNIAFPRRSVKAGVD